VYRQTPISHSVSVDNYNGSAHRHCHFLDAQRQTDYEKKNFPAAHLSSRVEEDLGKYKKS